MLVAVPWLMVKATRGRQRRARRGRIREGRFKKDEGIRRKRQSATKSVVEGGKRG